MDWEIKNKKLTKEFTLKNFIEAVAFINRVTPLAENMNHHPDILLHSYKKVKITLFTHDKNKITEKDHKLAKEIDEILS
jgi:4a-hydroxytetrahydrobiopterin dehydratase